MNFEWEPRQETCPKKTPIRNENMYDIQIYLRMERALDRREAHRETMMIFIIDSPHVQEK